MITPPEHRRRQPRKSPRADDLPVLVLRGLLAEIQRRPEVLRVPVVGDLEDRVLGDDVSDDAGGDAVRDPPLRCGTSRRRARAPKASSPVDRARTRPHRPVAGWSMSGREVGRIERRPCSPPLGRRSAGAARRRDAAAAAGRRCGGEGRRRERPSHRTSLSSSPSDRSWSDLRRPTHARSACRGGRRPGCRRCLVTSTS